MAWVYRTLKPRKKERTICVLGLDSHGKTTVLNQFRRVLGAPEEAVLPTTGQASTTLKHTVTERTPRPVRMRFHLTDLGGSRAIRDYWARYLPDADGIVFVVSGADRTRVDEAFTELVKVVEGGRAEGAPVLVVVSMQDKPGAVPPQEMAELLDLSTVLAGKRWLIVGSAGDGQPSRELVASLDWLMGHVAADADTIQRIADRKYDAMEEEEEEERRV